MKLEKIGFNGWMGIFAMIALFVSGDVLTGHVVTRGTERDCSVTGIEKQKRGQKIEAEINYRCNGPLYELPAGKVETMFSQDQLVKMKRRDKLLCQDQYRVGRITGLENFDGHICTLVPT